MRRSSAWTPDSDLVAALRPSPNHNERRGRERPDALVLHYTGMADGPVAIARLSDPTSEVSCHYVVEEDGTVVQLVPEHRRAWHAGRGSWAGASDMNSASIGVEIVNGGHDFGLPPFPDGQIDAVIAICRDVVQRYDITPERVLAHSDIAPERKQDPGERFPWDRLANAGVGLWVEPADDNSDPLTLGASGAAVLALQRDLARHGYGIATSGFYDGATAAVVRAFQRRFRSFRIDGCADVGTRDTLERLLRLRGGPGVTRGPEARRSGA